MWRAVYTCENLVYRVRGHIPGGSSAHPYSNIVRSFPEIALGDNSMAEKREAKKGRTIADPQDLHDVVKAALLEACATSPRAGFSSQRREVRKNRPPGHPTYRMAKALRDHSLLGTREMS